jgi:hypothetical protein
MKQEFNSKNINIVFSVVLPGDQKSWIDGGVAIANPELILKMFHDADRKVIEDLSDCLVNLSSLDRVAAMQAFEANSPALFRRLVAAITDAYYSAPAVVAQVEALANAGPREPSARFDDTLVATVIATQAGQYRPC